MTRGKAKEPTTENAIRTEYQVLEDLGFDCSWNYNIWIKTSVRCIDTWMYFFIYNQSASEPVVESRLGAAIHRTTWARKESCYQTCGLYSVVQELRCNHLFIYICSWCNDAVDAFNVFHKLRYFQYRCVVSTFCILSCSGSSLCIIQHLPTENGRIWTGQASQPIMAWECVLSCWPSCNRARQKATQ